MLKPMFFKVLLLLAVVLGVPGGVIGYWYYTSRPSYLLDRGEQALEKGEWKEADRLALLLDKKGYTQAAHLLRGEIFFHAAKALLEDEPAGFPYEEVQREIQMVMSAASLVGQPAIIRGPSWLLGSLRQNPFRGPSSSLNSFGRALAELTKIQDEGPNGIKGTVLAAECLVRLGEQRLAAEGLTAILKRDPNNRQAHRLLAAIYMDLNSAEDAIEHFKEWGRLDPSNGLPYRWIGFFYKDKNEDSSAREAYEEALKRRLTPEVKHDVLGELAEIHLLQGNYQLALDTLSQGGEDFLEAPEILTLRVQCLRATDRGSEAEQLVETALKKDPDFVPALFLKAQKFWTEEQPEKALPLLEKAIRQDPSNIKVGSLLMDVYQRKGDSIRANEQKIRNDKIRQQFQEIAEKLMPQAGREPWNDAIRLRLGELLLSLGQKAEARTWLEACLACNPNNYRARQLLNQIPRQGNLKGRPSSGSF